MIDPVPDRGLREVWERERWERRLAAVERWLPEALVALVILGLAWLFVLGFVHPEVWGTWVRR